MKHIMKLLNTCACVFAEHLGFVPISTLVVLSACSHATEQVVNCPIFENARVQV